MNFGEMRDQLRAMLDDPDGDKIPDELARLFLNSAYRKLWRKCIKYNKYFNIATVDITFTDQQMVIDDSTTPTRRIQKIILAVDSEGIPIPIKEKYESLHSEDRSIYTIRHRDSDGLLNYKVGWYVEPTNSPVVTFTFVQRVTEFPKNVVAEHTIDDIPEEHHDVIVLLAAILIIGKDEEAIGVWGEMYRDGLEDMIDTIGLKPETMQGVLDVEDY